MIDNLTQCKGRNEIYSLIQKAFSDILLDKKNLSILQKSLNSEILSKI